MVTNAVNVSIDYSAYSGMQLSALLDDIQNQRAILDDRERQIRKAISSLDIVSRIGLDEPTEETIDALNNSHAVLKTHDYAEFEKMIENE